MCLAKTYAEQILDIYNNIIEEYERLNKELSRIDLYLQDVLHIIENKKFNASDGYKYAKMIHDARVKRREIKNELIPLTNFKNYFVDKNKKMLNDSYNSITRTDNKLVDKTENKTYIPRVLEVNSPDQDTLKSISNQSKSTFTPIPIPSTPLPQTQEPKVIGTAIHIKTKERLQIINKIDDEHYVVKRINKSIQLLCKKNISNLSMGLEYEQVAK